MSEKNGGPAFPAGLYDGISKRDYFAAHALPALLEFHQPTSARARAMIVADAYAIADDMLLARVSGE
jgi:hypothetical protein